MPMLHRLDQTFKAKRINPGTTADLTVATLLVVFLEKLIEQLRLLIVFWVKTQKQNCGH
jgi:triphosphoribosyl-dephospho-CoA synthase